MMSMRQRQGKGMGPDKTSASNQAGGVIVDGQADLGKEGCRQGSMRQ